MANLKLRFAVRSILTGLAFAMILPATQAFSQDAKTLRDDIRQSQSRFEQLKIQYNSGTARYNSEMSQITSWIDEALILIGKDEIDKVKTLSLKIGVYIDFVDASLQRDVAMSNALEAESRLKSLKAEHGKLEAQVQQLEAEEQVLQSKLDSLKK